MLCVCMLPIYYDIVFQVVQLQTECSRERREKARLTLRLKEQQVRTLEHWNVYECNYYKPQSHSRNDLLTVDVHFPSLAVA